MSPSVLEAGGWDPAVGRAGSSWNLSPGRLDSHLLLCPHVVVPLAICVPSSSYKDPSPVTSGLKLVTSFYLLLLSRFSRVQLCATPETAAHQVPPYLGFSRQEHWSGVPFPSPMHESEKWKESRSVLSDSLRPHELQPTRLLCLWDSSGKNTVAGRHSLL